MRKVVRFLLDVGVVIAFIVLLAIPGSGILALLYALWLHSKGR